MCPVYLRLKDGLLLYTLTKIHKRIPVGRPIVSGNNGPTEHISYFVDTLLQPIAKIQESYINDTTILSTLSRIRNFLTMLF